MKASFVRSGILVNFLFLSLMFSPFCAAYSFEVGFTSEFSRDRNDCPGGNWAVNTGVVSLFVNKGYDCSVKDSVFQAVVCSNSGDMLKTIPPGGEASVGCVVDSSPFQTGPNCVKVSWCGQEDLTDYDLTPLGELRRETDELLVVRSSSSALGKEVTISKGDVAYFYLSESFSPITEYVMYPWADNQKQTNKEDINPGELILPVKYPSSGTYVVEITAYTNSGVYVDQATVNVLNLSIVLESGTVPGDLKENTELRIKTGQTVYFDASKTHGASENLFFAWDFKDGTKSIGASSEHLYTSPGTYLVSLGVSDMSSNTITRDLAVIVSSPIVAVLEASAAEGTAQDAQMRTGVIYAAPGSSVHYSGLKSDTGGSIVTYAWDYGDGSPVLEESTGEADHLYQTAGHYPATLTVSDGTNSGTDSIWVVVSVTANTEGPDALCSGSSTPGKLPSKFDWRSVNGVDYMTTVKNQGQCGSCWAFSIVGMIEAVWNIDQRAGSNYDLSEQELISCGNLRGCNGGSVSNAFDYVNDNGITSEGCFGYGDKDTRGDSELTTNVACASDKACFSSERYTLQASRIDVPTMVAGLMKQHLICYGPISTQTQHHAFIILGYDDNSETCKVHYGKSGCWIIKNSWGVVSGTFPDKTGFWKDIWHEDGYCYLPYDDYNTDKKSITLG